MNEEWRNEIITKGAAVDAIMERDQYAEPMECIEAIKGLSPAQPKNVCIAEIKIDGDELQECVNRAMDRVVQQQEQPEKRTEKRMETHGVCLDAISRQAAIDALKKAYWDRNIQSAKDDPCIVDAMTDWAIRQIKDLPSAQPEIIRCKDCKYIVEHHYEETGETPRIKYTCAHKAGLTKGYQVHKWDFCSRAERKDDE